MGCAIVRVSVGHVGGLGLGCRTHRNWKIVGVARVQSPAEAEHGVGAVLEAQQKLVVLR